MFRDWREAASCRGTAARRTMTLVGNALRHTPRRGFFLLGTRRDPTSRVRSRTMCLGVPTICQCVRRAWVSPLLLLVCGVMGIAAEGLAQTAFPAGIGRAVPGAEADRAELYRQLRSQAEFFERQSAVIKTAAKLVSPTVVFVQADASYRTAQPRGRRVEEAGSGVIVELGGRHYVLTARHVIGGVPPEGIKVTSADGRRLRPERVWEDPETDVAVMAVSAAALVAAPLGDSDRLEVGDFVLAVGSPFGLNNSVTLGIISGKGRRDLDLGESGVRLQDFLQTDAAINPGNSGGPLVNLRGEVVGITTAIASRSGASEGVGFAIPINLFLVVARQLIDQGRVARGFLGVTLDGEFGPAMAAELGLPRAMGARVVQVAENSPAAAAGLQVGDVVLRFGGVPVENDSHLVNLVGLTPAGKAVEVVILRDHRTQELRVTLGQRQ